jgi:hypothetical protein
MNDELNCNACGLFPKLVCVSFGFGMPTDCFALLIVNASHIHPPRGLNTYSSLIYYSMYVVLSVLLISATHPPHDFSLTRPSLGCYTRAKTCTRWYPWVHGCGYVAGTGTTGQGLDTWVYPIP